MAPAAIQAHGLGKRYFIAEGQTAGRKNLWPGFGSLRRGRFKEFWALRDVSFDIQQGEAVGIIGRNGAGKSTLLKLLSRVSAPTQGVAKVSGRVGTLLEVGTGFHPELTGRDNVFLSGTILGMKYAEIKRKFDEIVAFSEVEKFIDTPVKRYSSGMYVRLAFAVASFLEPDILIVDEVLAVGDSAFQRKSLGRLNDATAQQGRTVLFVSHNLQAIRSFCRRVLLLEKGRLVFDGPTQQGIERYLKSISKSVNLRGVRQDDRLNRTSGAVQFTGAVCYDHEGKVSWTIQTGGTIQIQFEFEALSDVSSLVFGIHLRAAVNGETITTIRKVVSETPVKAGFRGMIELTLNDLPLRPGEVSLYSWLAPADGKMPFDVIDENVDLPYLTVIANTDDAAERGGMVNLPYRLDVAELGAKIQASVGVK